MLSVIMLSVIMLSVIVLSVIKLNVVMQSIVAPRVSLSFLLSYHFISFERKIYLISQDLTTDASYAFFYNGKLKSPKKIFSRSKSG
jgi:hypothetical protein